MSQDTITPTARSSGPIGQPVERIDGRAKTTGAARYAQDHPIRDVVHGYVVGATIARGRILAMDTTRARRTPGVLYVMTYRNAPAQPDFGPPTTPTVPEVFTRARPMLASDRVRYFDEPIALVVAHTLAAARQAAGLIDVRYEAERGEFDMHAGMDAAYTPKRTNAGFATDSVIGDIDAAMRASKFAVDARYFTPYQSHNPMEPHASIAVWEGDQLTVHTSAQTVANYRQGLANTLRIPLERVRILTPYVGGGFGAKLIMHADTVLAALAAQVLRRPVKVALTRQQMYANAGHRAAMIHHVRLGADADGRLQAIGQDVYCGTSRFEEFCEQTAAFARALYAAPNRCTRHRLVPLDLNRGEWMRSPGEAPGMLAFESAIDELAHQSGMDPIELRVRNEPTADPETKAPFSTRLLVECMRTGAERFGWSRRNPRPASVREGRTLVGVGMSAAIRPNYVGASAATVSIDARARVVVRMDMTDIGTGTYTIVAQVAAQSLGVPVSWVRVELGDSRFPRTAGSGGSWGAASSGSATADACMALKRRILEAAQAYGEAAYANLDAETLQLAEGRIQAGGRTERLADLLARVAPGGLRADGRVGPMDDAYRKHSHHAHGAHFVEVGVDRDTGEIRMRRMLTVLDAGRILNPQTARSQVLGGMTWGISAALMEQTILDTRSGCFVNHDLAEYHIPVNADVPDLDVIFIEEPDTRANRLGVKGIGELGVCGAGAAVANAVFNATGIRVREFPITLDKLLPGLEALDV